MKFLEPFRFGVLQECKNVMRVLGRHGISNEEFMIWVDEEAIRLSRLPGVPSPPRQSLKRRCPNCDNTWLELHMVNHSRCTQVGGGYKTQWHCAVCGWDEFSIKAPIDEAKPYIVEEVV